MQMSKVQKMLYKQMEMLSRNSEDCVPVIYRTIRGSWRS